MNGKDALKRIEQIEEEARELRKIVEGGKDDDFEIKGVYFIDSRMDVGSVGLTPIPLTKCGNFNHFKTREQAEKMAKKTNAFYKFFHIGQYLNDGWMPDFEDNKQEKWLIYRSGRVTMVGVDYDCSVCNTVYFKSRELVKQAIEMMGEQSLKDLFEVV